MAGARPLQTGQQPAGDAQPDPRAPRTSPQRDVTNSAAECNTCLTKTPESGNAA
jgi:hypothetical protein